MLKLKTEQKMDPIMSLFCITLMTSSALGQQNVWYRTQNIGRANNPNERVYDHEHSQHHPSTMLRYSKNGPLERVYPGPLLGKSGETMEISEECWKKGYCTDTQNYPVEYVMQLVSRFGEEDWNRLQLDTLDEVSRAGGKRHQELCNTRTEIIHLTASVDKQGKWYTVLNLPNKPLQGFRVEICEEAESACSKIVRVQPGYSAKCHQKFIYRTMEALDDNQNQVTMPLKIPSCCSCVTSTI